MGENLEQLSSCGERPSLLVFADDWGRHPSSCQHLVGQLLPRYPVRWVNTIGMRAPRLDRQTLRRGIEKVRHWTPRHGSSGSAVPHLQVVQPFMWPWCRRQHDRWINRQLLLRQLAPLIASDRGSWIGLTTIPVVADLIGWLPVARWVYYCVDDFSVWPGLDQAAMASLERDLVQRVDRILVVSETLQTRFERWGRESHLLTHGVDLGFWQEGRSGAPAAALGSFERPRIVFWGLIDRRMDVHFIGQLARDLERGSIVLVGPLQDPDPDLLRLPRVTHIPGVPLSELPRVGAAADVLVMPYVDEPVTRAMQPLKLKEYLACDRPVVVRDLPSTRCWSDCLDIASDAEAFSRITRQRAQEGMPPTQRSARIRLEEESWAAKAQAFERLVLEDLVGI